MFLGLWPMDPCGEKWVKDGVGFLTRKMVAEMKGSRGRRKKDKGVIGWGKKKKEKKRKRINKVKRLRER